MPHTTRRWRQSEDPNGSLKLLQLAQFRLGQGSDHPRAATLGSWLSVDSAHSLAMLGHTEQARSSLAAARDGWDPADRFDRADMDHVMAQVHRELGMLDAAGVSRRRRCVPGLRATGATGYRRASRWLPSTCKPEVPKGWVWPRA
jgi:hypothetical protein